MPRTRSTFRESAIAEDAVATKWTVKFLNRRLEKHVRQLPPAIQEILAQLVKDIAESGPVQRSWPNYSKLGRKKGQGAKTVRHHCHLKKGRPTYVAIWHELGEDITVEISYVGTHEGGNREY